MGKTFKRNSDNNNFRKLKRQDVKKSKKLKRFLDKNNVNHPHFKPMEIDEDLEKK